MTPLNVLVVDDEEFVRSLLSTIIRRNGHTVLEASTSAEAREKFAREPAIDCIVLDAHLADGTTGNALSHEFKGERPNVKIVLISGDVIHLSPHRADCVLGKPFSFDQILSALVPTRQNAA